MTVSTIANSLSLFIILILTNIVHANNELPSIGENVTVSSAKEEKRIGQTWLSLYRRQVPITSDPILVEYTESLLQRLAKYTPAAGEEFSLVITKNNTINAFAVPGGVIGVNTGLYYYAQTEDQFASVLAHELAHLSQRHYARNVAKQKGTQLLNMAALLGSLVIAATSGGDAGIAAISATQAGIIDQRLRFSRLFEEEADRIALNTLVKAGFDPHSMSDMFAQMQRASQFSTKPPEFLLTHPITARRIADAENRARKFPKQFSPSSLNYDLVRSRVVFYQEATSHQAVQRFESEIRGFSPSETGSRYGLVLALIASKQYNRAEEVLKPLLEQYPNHHALILAQSDMEAGNQKLPKALDTIQTALEHSPQSYSLNLQYSRLLTRNNNYSEAVKVLNKMRLQRPKDPYVWYNLAEVAGLSGEILKLHKARAEYFILYGDFDSAEKQLNNLIKKFSDEKSDVASAKQRLLDIDKMREASKL